MSWASAEQQYYDYDRYMRNIECDDEYICDDCTARGEDDDE